MKTKQPTIGLALGSGAARGLAHIGVLKVLEEHAIPIDYIAGTSIGAMIGCLYASGLNAADIEKIALNMTNRDMFSMVDPGIGKGFIRGDKVQSFIERTVAVNDFKDCRIPFAATATDIHTGDIVVLNSGNLAEAVRASISMPFVFQPVEREGRVLVDGGVGSPVPVELVRGMGADIVIAVNLDKHYIDETWRSGMLDIANHSMNIMRHYLSLYQSRGADIVLTLDLGSNTWYDFVNGQTTILAGERSMQEEMSPLQELIRSKRTGFVGRFVESLKRTRNGAT